MSSPSRIKLVLAFLAIYVIWGSTYLAIRLAIETLPPLLMAGVRFIIAGSLLYGWAKLFRGAPPPARSHWKSASIVGLCLLMGGNGGVAWAQQWVPSGLAALIVAVTPMWMVLFDWARHEGVRPSRGVLLGLVLGFSGMVLLVGPGAGPDSDRVNPLGAAGVVFATLCWAMGSIYSRRADLPQSQALATGMEMLIGGAALILLGSVTGEWTRLEVVQISFRSWLAVCYLIFFGSLIGFSAYTWLLRVCSPSSVSTYAYVNPIVAVFLGWAVAGEPVTLRILTAAAVIVSAVAMIISGRTRQPRTLIPYTEKIEFSKRSH